MISVYTFYWWAGISSSYEEKQFVEVCADNWEEAQKRFTTLTGKTDVQNYNLIRIEQRMGQSDLVKALKDFLE